MNYKVIIAITLQPVSLLCMLLLSSLQVHSQHTEKELKSGWKAKKALEVPADGTQISMTDYECYDWLEATVPGTVLTTLLHNGKIPDPFIGMNNEMIPDIYTVGRDYYTYWFITDFTIPASLDQKITWITFRGINYYAEVFINGKRINREPLEGMFIRHTFNISSYLSEKGKNRIAVLVKPPDPAGNPNGGQGGDGTIGRSVTNQFAAGWDWIQPVRDRNTGIWDKVYIFQTGQLVLKDPFIKTRVPGKRQPDSTQDPASVFATVDIVNSSGIDQHSTVELVLDGKTFSYPVYLKPEEQQTVNFTEIVIKDPKLWWPNGYGRQELYEAEFRVIQGKGVVSDRISFKFGIREFSTLFDKQIGARTFFVNGQKIFIKGGNWIASDAIYRLSEKRYDAEVRMHAEMNLNMIRVWGGSIMERPEFYAACDKYGILVMQDLWITGDCNGRWNDPMKLESQARRREYPDNHPLFLASLVDQVKMLRNHASLCIWCGGNEFPPPQDIQERIEKNIMPELDGTRYYLPESTSDSLLTNTIGGNGDGPYNIREPEWFFTFKSYPFNPEIGSVGLPSFESLKIILDEKVMTMPSAGRYSPVWRYHKYLGYGDFIDRFGTPADLKEYCQKAQIVNYDQYRALIEGWNAHMWDWYTGILIWKTQNPWTALRGMMYDPFLDQNGGFYGVRKASEPLHIQFNLNDSSVCLVNHTFQSFEHLTCYAALFDLKGKTVSHQEEVATISPSSKKDVFTYKIPEEAGDIFFLKLHVNDRKGSLLTENLYWLTTAGKDYSRLNELSEVKLNTGCKITRDKNEIHLEVAFENPGDEVSFFNRLQLVDPVSNDRILPAYYSDNYFTLLPGESKKISIHIPAAEADRDSVPGLWIEGWNTPLTKIF